MASVPSLPPALAATCPALASVLPPTVAHCPATATLSVPEVAARLSSFVELFEGVRASTANLAPMLDLLRDNCEEFYVEPTACRHAENFRHSGYVKIAWRHEAKISKKEKTLTPFIDVRVYGPSESTKNPNRYLPHRPYELTISAGVQFKSFSGTTEGLADALAYGKDCVRRLKAKDFCEHCRYDGTLDSEAPPQKRFKATPLPVCAECAIKKSLDL